MSARERGHFGITRRRIEPEPLGVPREHALPAECVLQMAGKHLLDEPVFAAEVGKGYRVRKQ